jgi:hypothetical protein
MYKQNTETNKNNTNIPSFETVSPNVISRTTEPNGLVCTHFTQFCMLILDMTIKIYYFEIVHF